MRKSICIITDAIVFTCAICPFSSGRDLLAGEALAKVRAVGASSIEYKSGMDSSMNENEYFSKLQAADEKTFRQDFEMYFLLILDARQEEDYQNCKSLHEKKAYMQYYWKAANPNPLLPENDWLLEFNRRVQYAKEHFRRSSPPYVDDRGRYYIKYGKPHRQFVDFGGPIRYERSRIFYSTIANETWSYENIHPNFVVYFIQEGTSFRKANSIYEAVLDKRIMRYATRSPDPNMEYYIWGDMIVKRESISITLSEAALDIRNPRFTPPQAALKVRSVELAIELNLARDKAPVTARDPIQAENKLEFFDQIAQFRGSRGKTRIEIALLAPLKKNLVKKVKKSSKDTLNVEFSGMLRDLNFEPMIQNQAFSSFAVKLAEREKLPNAVGKLALLAEPQSAELTLQVAEKQLEKAGYYRQTFEIRDFSSKSELLISDIQLNYEVKNDTQKKILPILQYQSLLVSPYPYQEISKKKPPLVYFEIYNIQLAGIHENLQISYTITSIKDNSNVLKSLRNLFYDSEQASVSVSYTRPVVSENMQELIEIDFKNVKKGWNLLEVSVSSMENPKIRVAMQKKLFVGKK